MSVAGFKLTLWIPVEQVGIVIGRSGATINKIQGGTSSRLNVVPDADASAWAPVYIRGAPDGVFAAAQQVVELVDDIDDCVAEFHLGGRGRTLLRDENSSPSNLAPETKKVSAEHNVRILIPQATGNARSDNKPSKDDAAPCSLEGPLEGVKKALNALVAIAARKIEKPVLPSVPQVEKCVSVPATRLRTVARRGQQQPVYRVVARYSGTQVAKRPRDQPMPDDCYVAREPESALAQAALTVESVVEACTEEPTRMRVLPDAIDDDFEDPGCSEDESESETESEDDSEAAATPTEERVGFMVRGGERNVDAACQALVQIVEGGSVKDVVAKLKLEFPTASSRRGGRGGNVGKESAPGAGRRSRNRRGGKAHRKDKDKGGGGEKKEEGAKRRGRRGRRAGGGENA